VPDRAEPICVHRHQEPVLLDDMMETSVAVAVIDDSNSLPYLFLRALIVRAATWHVPSILNAGNVILIYLVFNR
jgi:hypothetical protein